MLTLKVLVHKLSENKSGSAIPYKDSKLTRYMQRAFEGYSKMALICTLSPSQINIEETSNTISFALRAKNLSLSPKINEVKEKDAFILEYEKQIKRLKDEIRNENSDGPLSQLDKLQAAILVSGEVNLGRDGKRERNITASTKPNDQLRDITEEMETKIRMSASIEKHYKRLKNMEKSKQPLQKKEVPEIIMKESEEVKKEIKRFTMPNSTKNISKSKIKIPSSESPKKQEKLPTKKAKPKAVTRNVAAVALNTCPEEGIIMRGSDEEKELKELLKKAETNLLDELKGEYSQKMRVTDNYDKFAYIGNGTKLKSARDDEENIIFRKSKA